VSLYLLQAPSPASLVSFTHTFSIPHSNKCQPFGPLTLIVGSFIHFVPLQPFHRIVRSMVTLHQSRPTSVALSFAAYNPPVLWAKLLGKIVPSRVPRERNAIPLHRRFLLIFFFLMLQIFRLSRIPSGVRMYSRGDVLGHGDFSL